MIPGWEPTQFWIDDSTSAYYRTLFEQIYTECRNYNPKAFKRVKVRSFKYGWTEHILVRAGDDLARTYLTSMGNSLPRTKPEEAQREQDVQWVSAHYHPIIALIVANYWDEKISDVQIDHADVERIHDQHVTDYVDLKYLEMERLCLLCETPFRILTFETLEDTLEVFVVWECYHALFTHRFKREE